MSLFVEVVSIEKGCTVILNLDAVQQIVPIRAGGCLLEMTDGRQVKISDSYELFRQFAMQTVSSDDIAKRVKSLKGTIASLEVPKL